MSLRWNSLTLTLWVAAASTLTFSSASANPETAPAPSDKGQASAALSSALRSYLIAAFPQVAYEKTTGWGKTTRVLTGLKLKGGKGKYAEKNNGTWKKARITTPPLSEVLVLAVTDIGERDTGALGLTLRLAFPARVDYTQQKWASGVKLYDASVRARMDLAFTLQCEVAMRLDAGKGFFPDAVLRFRVLRADLRYNKVVVEHIAGVGGTAAKVIGETVVDALKKWHPALERHLVEKADAAIVKAGGNKEVRISLDKLLKVRK